MTTILADFARRMIVADSHATDEDRAWSIRKVHRIRGALVACSGSVIAGEAFCDWFRADDGSPPDLDMADSSILVMDSSGLYVFDDDVLGLTKVPGGVEAIGSGAKGALCAYDALDRSDMRKAVRVACKYDAHSRAPVRSFKL